MCEECFLPSTPNFATGRVPEPLPVIESEPQDGHREPVTGSSEAQVIEDQPEAWGGLGVAQLSAEETARRRIRSEEFLKMPVRTVASEESDYDGYEPPKLLKRAYNSLGAFAMRQTSQLVATAEVTAACGCLNCPGCKAGGIVGIASTGYDKARSFITRKRVALQTEA